MKPAIAILCFAALFACGNGSVANLMDSIRKLDRRREHGAERVTIRHILIGFAGTVPRLRRTRAEAEKLTADLLARLQAGGDFAALMHEFSSDSGLGVFELTKDTRGDVAQGVGDVAWRLEVNEIGVAPYDPNTSPRGWHLIQRTK